MIRFSAAKRSLLLGEHYTGQAFKSSTAKVLPAVVGMGEESDFSFPFSFAKVGRFVQEPPQLGNQYKQDPLLQSFLKRHISKQYLSEVESDLTRFGQRVATDLYELHLRCEREPPTVEQTDAWGHRVDRLVTSTAWKDMHSVAAKEGLIALAYQRQHAESSRLFQMAKLYLYAPSSGLYSCPLAMADGAAKILESEIVTNASPLFLRTAYQRLTSRDPLQFWTSGQWMTEKGGGSDVARGTETIAVKQSDGDYYCLYGYKWFSSATDADMTLTLARILNKNGTVVEGSKGLTLFYLELRNEDGKLNNIQLHKLKNKLGTRQLPTAELLIDGAKAYKMSEEGRGVAAISNMLTLTRLHNTISAASSMRRMINLARDYSTKRKAFGSLLKDYPLHIQTLARMEVEARGATILALELARLLGLEEVNKITESQQHLLRLLIPVAKLYTGKQAIRVASEGLECFGGQGFIEDTGLPAILRDAQVLTIWEGTTNILSLDVLRAISKSHGAALQAFVEDIDGRLLKASGMKELQHVSGKVKQGAQAILEFATRNTSQLEIAARDFAYSIARVAVGALLIEHAASHVGTAQDIYAAHRWCDQDLCPILGMAAKKLYTSELTEAERKLVFEGFYPTSHL